MFYGIHYMRGFAALLVLLAHINFKMTKLHGWGDSQFGAIGVDIFFIISGFVIGASYELKNKSSREFLRDRFIRVVPLYWFLTIVALAVFLIRPEIVNSSGGVTSIFSSFTLIPNGEKILIQNGWTLSYEMYFYLLFAISISLVEKFRIATPIVLTTLLLIGGLGVGFVFSNNSWLAFNSIVIEFVFGMILYKGRRIFVPNGWIVVYMLSISLGAYFFLRHHLVDPPRFLSCGVPAFFLLLGIINAEPLFKRISGGPLGRVGRVLGDFSYSLYLVHPFGIAAVGIVARKIGLGDILTVFSMIFASLVLGLFTWKFVELPVTQFTKYRLNRRAAVSQTTT